MTSAIEVLRELGADSDAVAKTLYDLGIRGHRTSAYNCPVAKYLNSKGHPMAIVSSAAINTEYDGCFNLRDCSLNAVGSFVERFDFGDFNYLEQLEPANS